MFDERRERRRLRKRVENAKKREEPLVDWNCPDFEDEAFLEARRKTRWAEYRLDRFESEVLTALALKYGVETLTDSRSWNDDSEGGMSPEDVTSWLTPKGQAKLRASIREQQRKNWEFWIKVIAALTGLVGSLIGVIAVLKK